MDQRYWRECNARIAEAETQLKSKAPSAALLLSDSKVMADKNKLGHAVTNKLHAMTHEKRRIGAQVLGMGAGIGTGIGVSSAVGGGAAALAVGGTVALGAITGGIAIGVLVLGIGIAAGVAAYVSSVKKDTRERIDGLEHDSPRAMMKDLKYLMSHGITTELARYFEKAVETEKQLIACLDGATYSCTDAHKLAFAMYRHKRRLEEKLVHGHQMGHLGMYKHLFDTQIIRSADVIAHFGRLHTINVMRWLYAGDTTERAKAFNYAKAAAASGEVRDYVDLKWQTWFEDALNNRLPERAHSELTNSLAELQVTKRRAGSTLSRSSIQVSDESLKNALAAIIHKARTSSDGDHNNLAGKITENLLEKLKGENDPAAVVAASSGVSSSSTTSRTNAVEKFTTDRLMDIFLTAGKTAATTASNASALGSSAVGSMANVAASSGAGFAAGILVTTVLTAVFDAINDKNNAKAIALGTIESDAERVWILRAMLEAGRIDTMYESYKKAQKSMEDLFALYDTYEFVPQPGSPGGRGKRPMTFDAVVLASKLLVRTQKHLLKMLAMNAVLTMFLDTLEECSDAMMNNYLKKDGLADRVIKRVTMQTQHFDHRCPDMCYALKAQDASNKILVVNRMTGVT